MLRYIAIRALSLSLSLVVASVVIFALIEVIPGDPASFMLGLNATEETRAALRRRTWLGRVQTGNATSRGSAAMLTGDFGTSYTYRVPVSELVLDRIWLSLPLAIYALTLSTLIAFPRGHPRGRQPGRGAGLRRHGGHAAGHRDPEFSGFAMLLVLLFRGHAAVVLCRRLFPGWDQPGAAIKSLTLPAIALALPQASILARVMRSALLETLGQDYIRTARAKGLSRRQAVLRHALKNALIPVLTIIGLQFSFLLAGAIIIENVFFLPGLGRLIFQGITQRDLVVVESVTMLLVFAVIVVTFLVDIAYALVDPRLRRR